MWLTQSSSGMQLVFEEEFWSLYPNFFEPELFDRVWREVQGKVRTYQNFIAFKGKFYESPRQTCVVGGKSQQGTPLFNYDKVPFFEWAQCSILQEIRSRLEETLKLRFDYCLVHIYQEGKNHISWHNDKEAWSTGVASVSLGQTRKFRLRKLGRKSGCDYQYFLENGDLLYMKPGCQQHFEHCVPKELALKKPRINLTFRQLDGKMESTRT
jgi:alkylated DNA repair dioxygenase AlkB